MPLASAILRRLIPVNSPSGAPDDVQAIAGFYVDGEAGLDENAFVGGNLEVDGVTNLQGDATIADNLILGLGGAIFSAADEVVIGSVGDPQDLLVAAGRIGATAAIRSDERVRASLFFELFAGSTAPVSDAGTARIRYNEVTDMLQVSKNGAAYVDLI